METQELARAASIEAKTPPSAESFYRPELDALRFFAFFLVFLFHLLPDRPSRMPLLHNSLISDVASCVFLSFGFGVCLFFLLSAYLITTLLIRERAATSTIDLAAFYRRRILRIWPLYFIVLAVAFSVRTLLDGFPGTGLLAAYLLMAGNMTGHFHILGDTRPLKLYHLWSISVEEQFYLFFPAIARKVQVSFLPVISATVVLMMVVTVAVLSHAHTPKEGFWYNSFVEFIMFAAGIFIAWLFAARTLPQLATLTRFALLAAGALCCFSAQYFFRIRGEGFYVPASNVIFGYLFVMVGCSLALLSVLGYKGRLPRFLIYLGKISYGLYVFHVWCITFAAFLIGTVLGISMEQGKAGIIAVLAKDGLALCLTVMCAAASYRFIEKPFLRLKRRFEIIKTRAA